MGAKKLLTKPQLRRQLLTARAHLNKSPDYKKVLSAAIFEQLATLPIWQRSQVVHSYLPKQNEVDVWPVIKWLWHSNHEVWGSYLPEDSQADGFVQLTPSTQYETDRYRAPLPLGKVHSVCSPTVVLMPAVAVDKFGVRLGYGGGWYDRFLSEHPAAVRVCLIDESFVQGELPREPHDQKLDLIVTNSKIIHTKRL